MFVFCASSSASAQDRQTVASAEVERAFDASTRAGAWTTAEGDRVRQKALFVHASADPGGDAVDTAKIELFFGLSQGTGLGRQAITRGTVQEDQDCALLNVGINFAADTASPRGYKTGAIFLIRQAGLWRVLPPFGNVVTSATVRALPAEQQKRLAALVEGLPRESRPTVDAQDDLALAVAGNDAAAAERAVADGASWTGRSQFGGTPLSTAVHCDRPDIVRLLLARGADPAVEPRSLLCHALREGQNAVAEILVDTGKGLETADRALGHPPLAEAVQYGNLGLAKRLVDAGVKPNPNDLNSPLLHLAAASGDYETFAWAKQFYTDLRVTAGQNANALHMLASGNLFAPPHGDGARIARELIAAGIDPKASAGKRHDPVATPLVVAAKSRFQAPVIKALLENVSYTPDELTTALTWAVRGSTAQGVSALLAAGATLTGEAWKFAAPLYQAAGRQGNAAMLRVLLDAGCLVDAHRESSRRTALHTAVVRGDADGVRLLLDRGADAAVLDVNEQSILELAIARAANGVERDSLKLLSPEYRPEQPNRPDTGHEVLEAVKGWFATHPDAAERVRQAKQALHRVVSRPAASPAEAVDAFLKAFEAKDVSAAQSLTFLPGDVHGRRRVLGLIAEAAGRGPKALPPLAPRVEGTLAVVEVRAREAGEEPRSTPMFVVLRNGGWLVVYDQYAFGPPPDSGLTEAESEAVIRVLKAAQK